MNKVFSFKAGEQIIEKGGVEFRRRARIVGAYAGDEGEFYKIFWIDNPTNQPQFELFSRATIETFYELVSITKKCNCCGKLFVQIPTKHRFSECDLLGGWYWECACGSTLFVPIHRQ